MYSFFTSYFAWFLIYIDFYNMKDKQSHSDSFQQLFLLLLPMDTSKEFPPLKFALNWHTKDGSFLNQWLFYPLFWGGGKILSHVRQQTDRILPHELSLAPQWPSRAGAWLILLCSKNKTRIWALDLTVTLRMTSPDYILRLNENNLQFSSNFRIPRNKAIR